MPSGSQGRASASKHPQSRQVVLNPYRIMWLIVMFDLPTVKTEERRDYQLFHKYLLADGFSMMQYSIYMRFCASPEHTEVHRRRVSAHLPPEGQVRVLELTSKQFERMKVYEGKIRKRAEKEPSQLELF